MVSHSKILVIGALMLVAAGLTFGMTPRNKVAEERPSIDLETMIPKQFSEWQEVPGLLPISALDPEAQEESERIYDQVLMRSYTNADGKRIMLAVAYSGDQSDGLQVHKPEVCYTAQGFSVDKKKLGTLNFESKKIPVVRVLATNGPRVEPITYWITVGDKVVVEGSQRKLAQLKFGLSGQIPDGMLVRVSNITSDEEGGYELQSKFINDMIAAIDPEIRQRLVAF